MDIKKVKDQVSEKIDKGADALKNRIKGGNTGGGKGEFQKGNTSSDRTGVDQSKVK